MAVWPWALEAKADGRQQQQQQRQQRRQHMDQDLEAGPPLGTLGSADRKDAAAAAAAGKAEVYLLRSRTSDLSSNTWCNPDKGNACDKAQVESSSCGRRCDGWFVTTNRVTFVVLLMALGAVSISIFLAYAARSAEAQARAVFEGEAKIVTNSARLALKDAASASLVIRTYMDAANGTMSREAFRSFAAALLETTSADTFQYIPEVRGAREREEFEAEAALYWRERVANQTEFPIKDVNVRVDPATGQPESVLEEAEEADAYYPVKYVAPIEGNEVRININALSVLGLGEAITHSVSTGETLSIGPRHVKVDVDGAYISCIIVLVPLETENAVVLETMRVHNMMSRVLAELPEGRELYIFCAQDDSSSNAEGSGSTSTNGTEMLFGGFAGTPLRPVAPASLETLRERRFYFQRDFEELGRNWTVVACSDDDYATVGDTRTVVTSSAMLGVLFVGVAALCIILMHRAAQYSRKQAQVIADQARIEAKAVTRAERNLNDFLAHEVRNPLSVAIAAQRFLHMSLQEATWADSEVSAATTRDVELIGSSLTFILDLVTNMLDLNKCLEQQTVVLNPTTVSLGHDVLGPVKSMLGRDISGISIQLEVEEGDVWVLADGLRLKQVVMNLAKNAIKFVETGFVRLSAHRVSPERVIIAVEDSGPGVPEHKMGTMFSKYQESLDKMHQGTGIGLCLSKLIVNSMHGDLYLDTDYNSGVEGCPGARFVVDVPLEVVKPPALAPRALPEPDANVLATRLFTDKAILVVDDDPVVRAILVRRLKHLFSGVSIKTASSGEAAFALLAELGMDSFAVIFMDHYMPGPGSPMTGVEAIQRLRAEGFDGLVFGCSANDVRRQHLKAGADEFFLKPLPADAVVSRAIQRCSALREVRSVLVVDDQKVNLLVLKRLLQSALSTSATITSDTSGEAALTRDDHFDVVILDEHMGTGLLGSQVAARMRARGSQSLIISLSGGGLGEAVVTDKHASGFDALWEKPLPPADVLRDQLVDLLLKKAVQQPSATPPVSPMEGDTSTRSSPPPASSADVFAVLDRALGLTSDGHAAAK